MVKVKICGITRVEDAQAAIHFGADSIGFNFYKESPRYVTQEDAKSIIDALHRPVDREIKTVGVFVNANTDTIHEITNYTGIDIIQLHGEEGPEVVHKVGGPVIKAIRVNDRSSLKTMVDYHVSYYLLDSHTSQYGGSGVQFDWQFANEASKYGMIILAGGLTIENIQEAIRRVNPYGVDICSSIEDSAGIKNHNKMRQIIELAKSV